MLQELAVAHEVTRFSPVFFAVAGHQPGWGFCRRPKSHRACEPECTAGSRPSARGNVKFSSHAGRRPDGKSQGDPKEELQGVFIISNKKEAVFVPVTTGISGTTDIEVTKGLKEGDQIVTGSYKVLRTLRNGASVKVDNSVKPKSDES